ncbi:MAG: hypothetical protein ACKOCB_00455 [Planctomycetia bacterium]
MAVSPAVRRYYAERIFAHMGRDKAPANFRPLGVPAHGMSTVEGCRGGGKNILEVQVLVEQGRLADLRASCGLCNPAMYVGVDVVLEWARGQQVAALLALDPLAMAALEPLYARLGGPGKPDDAREKMQYALVAVQAALRKALGQAAVATPGIEPPTDRDWAAGS